MLDLIQLIWQILMIPVALVVGRFQERKHTRSLDERDALYRGIRVTNLKRVTDPETVTTATAVIGHVVIATDYYKTFVTSLKRLIGGELKAAQTLLIRARREALLRMIAEAHQLGATEVWNVRFSFSNIYALSNQANMQVEMIAYGTAVKRR